MSAPVPELVLYRCACAVCDAAETALRPLVVARGAGLEVRRAESEGPADAAGWSTPAVYANGIEISHYALSIRKWKLAAAAPVERIVLAGEVVDLVCCRDKGEHGPGHQGCAEHCVKELGLPMALLTAEGTLYKVAPSRKSAVTYEDLKTMIGRKVRVDGEVYRWGEARTLIVRAVL